MNPHSNPDIIYGVYTRKSSEHEDSQVQSIQRQIDELAVVITNHQLTVHGEVIRESQSAFHPGRREFAKLVERTQEGRINAWLCWHANRLSRNSMDSGTIVYLMDQGKLHHIRTRDRIYENNPSDKFMLQMEFTISKKDSDDKSELVKSGILRRHRRGYPNGSPPAGYANSYQKRSGHSFWIADPERFDKVRLVLRRFLLGKDSLSSITRYAREIGLTTYPKSRIGGRPVVRSAMHSRILTNPVYAGRFKGIDGKAYELDPVLPRILTETEFQRVQQILGDRKATSGKRVMKTATYRGIIRGPRNEYMGPDFKFQTVCDCKAKFSSVMKVRCPRCRADLRELKNPVYRSYIYYSVVRDRVDPGIVVRSVEEKRIDRCIVEKLASSITITKEMRDWAFSHIDACEDRELRRWKAEAKEAEARMALFTRRRDRLRELLLEGLITKDEYRTEISLLEGEQEEHRVGLEKKTGDSANRAKRILNLAVELGNIMRKGEPPEKRQAILDIGSNLRWDGKEVLIYNAKNVDGFIYWLKKAKEKNSRFEPSKFVDFNSSNAAFRDVMPELLRGVDALRTFSRLYPQALENKGELGLVA